MLGASGIASPDSQDGLRGKPPNPAAGGAFIEKSCLVSVFTQTYMLVICHIKSLARPVLYFSEQKKEEKKKEREKGRKETTPLSDTWAISTSCLFIPELSSSQISGQMLKK